MTIIIHQFDDLGERLEVRSLLRAERVSSEEFYQFGEILQSTNAVFESVAVVGADASKAEESPNLFQQHFVSLVLRHSEFGENLPPQTHLLDSVDSDIEAALTVHETGDPTRI
jgi:hypothetical protein